MHQTLVPEFVDHEDLDIFKIVDSPEEALEWVKRGTRRPWWKPQDTELLKAAMNGSLGHKNPLAGAKATATGEGTRYGKRPIRPNKTHVKAKKKPQQ